MTKAVWKVEYLQNHTPMVSFYITVALLFFQSRKILSQQKPMLCTLFFPQFFKHSPLLYICIQKTIYLASSVKFPSKNKQGHNSCTPFQLTISFRHTQNQFCSFKQCITHCSAPRRYFLHVHNLQLSEMLLGQYWVPQFIH